MRVSERSQIVLIWWSIAFAIVFAVAFVFLLNMVPPPRATLSSEEIKAWYEDNATEIKIGATIASYTSAFLVPLFIVVGAQMARQEKGFPLWSMMTIIGGSFASIFLVLPPICWGVAAFTPGRDADVTAIFHEFGIVMLVTTDQYFLFPWVAMIVVSFLPATAKYSPFPRWYGYMNIWFATMFELGALAYNFETGPFSWRGLFVFYVPFTLFTVWIIVTCTLLLKAIKQQGFEAVPTEPGAVPVGVR